MSGTPYKVDAPSLAELAKRVRDLINSLPPDMRRIYDEMQRAKRRGECDGR